MGALIISFNVNKRRKSHDDASAAINFKKFRPDTPGLLLVEPPRLFSIISSETCVQRACDKKRSGY
jgi:hypothetical protein